MIYHLVSEKSPNFSLRDELHYFFHVKNKTLFFLQLFSALGQVHPPLADAVKICSGANKYGFS